MPSRRLLISGIAFLLILFPAITHGQIIPSYLGEWTFPAPEQIALDGAGNVYVSQNDQIAKYSSDGSVLYWSKSAADLSGSSISGVAVLGDTVYVPAGPVQKLSAATGDRLENLFLTRGTRPFVNSNGIYLTQSWSIGRYDLQGNLVSTWGARGTGPGFFEGGPASIAESTNGTILTTDFKSEGSLPVLYTGRIQEFTLDGLFLREVLIPHTSTDGPIPYGIGVDPTIGWVFVTDFNLHRIYLFDSDLNYIDYIGTQPASFPGYFLNPRSVAVSQTGVFYVADYGSNRIQYFTLGSLQVPTRKTTWGKIKTLYGGETE